MKLPEDKTVKYLLKSGQVVNAYTDHDDIVDLKRQHDFIKVRDDGNTIYLNPRHIMVFEVLDDRRDSPVPETPVQEHTEG